MIDNLKVQMSNHFYENWHKSSLIPLRLIIIYTLFSFRNLEGVVYVNFENAL